MVWYRSMLSPVLLPWATNLGRLDPIYHTTTRRRWRGFNAVVAQKSRFCHSTPVLSDFYWLPVRHRISFKIAMDCFQGAKIAEVNLSCISHSMICTPALRSSSFLSICVPPRKTTIATSKSFTCVALNIWNVLLNHLSSIPTILAFRKALKHHLFLPAYPDSSAKSGKIKISSMYITLVDTAPTIAIAQPGNTMPPI